MANNTKKMRETHSLCALCSSTAASGKGLVLPSVLPPSPNSPQEGVEGSSSITVRGHNNQNHRMVSKHRGVYRGKHAGLRPIVDSGY